MSARNKEHDRSAQHAHQTRVRQEKRRRDEQREGGWNRDDFFRDLRTVSRRMTDEISRDPGESREIREGREQIRRGQFKTQAELDAEIENEEG